MEFKPIETQEDFDAAIKDRLDRQERKIRGEYADYEELRKRSESWDTEKESLEKDAAKSKADFEELSKEHEEAKQEIERYKTEALRSKVAAESGLPYGMAGYLKGATEAEIRKSAEELGKLAKGGQTTPLADLEDKPPKDKKQAALRQMLKEMKGE